jgi:hypothetical protein
VDRAVSGRRDLAAAMAIGTIAEYGREHLHPRWRSELEL